MRSCDDAGDSLSAFQGSGNPRGLISIKDDPRVVRDHARSDIQLLRQVAAGVVGEGPLGGIDHGDGDSSMKGISDVGRITAYE